VRLSENSKTLGGNICAKKLIFAMLLKRFIVGTNELEEVIQAGNDENARNQPL
jgi:hypothetical protein